MNVVVPPIRPISAGLDDEQPYAYGLTVFPNGLYAVLRFDLAAEGGPGEVEWKPCSHSTSEEVVQGAIRRWTGLSVPLWWIRAANRTEAP